MKLLRKRWWGFYALSPILLLSALIITFQTITNTFNGNLPGVIVGIVVAMVCITGTLLLYAPYTFHNALRFIGLTITFVYIAYFIDSLFNGSYLSAKISSASAINALMGFIVFGIPGFLLFWKCKKSKRNPYRSDGTLRKPLLRDIAQYNENIDEHDVDNNDAK